MKRGILLAPIHDVADPFSTNWHTRKGLATAQVSFVELVGPANIQWFISHSWQMPVRHFSDSIFKHAQSYQKSWRDSAYWMLDGRDFLAYTMGLQAIDNQAVGRCHAGTVGREMPERQTNEAYGGKRRCPNSCAFGQFAHLGSRRN